ncbi:ABC transporter permease [Escherichia coli]|nr:ABC transporter permease [Escherichia coli]
MPMFLFLRRLRHSPAAFCGLIIILLLMLIALFAPWLAPHDPNWQDAAARLQAPSRQHWLGTDSYGRDLLSRLIYGSRPALGLVNGALALALTTWPAYARQARSEIQRLRHSDYLAAAEMMGIRGRRLLAGHILPLCLPSAIVRLALDLAGIILAAAGLGFLGLGARPPMAEWGAMTADGMQVIFDQWWIAAAPGAIILIASLAFNLLGDGLRDVLEPQHD